MCLTCGYMQAHLEMGDNVRYEDVKRIANANGRTVDETLDIMRRTVEIDQREHEQGSEGQFDDTASSAATGSGAWK